MELGKKTDTKIVMCALAACLTVWGCTTREELDSRAVIRLGVSGETRAAVNDFDGLRAVGDNIGIYGVKTTGHSSATGEDWSFELFSEDAPDEGTLIMNNVRTASIDESGAVHWSGRYHYPLDVSAGVKFCAYHPHVDAVAGYSIADPAVGQAPVLSFRLDGTQDVMYAQPIVGWRDKATRTSLLFRHVLTQLTFSLLDPEHVFAGKKVNGITLKDVNTGGRMNIETGAVSDWGSPVSLPVGGFDAPVEISAEAGSGGQRMGSEIMLQPGQRFFKVAVDIDGKVYDNIEIRPAAPATMFERGKRYEIVLTFVDREPIFMGATVEPWEFVYTDVVEVL